MAKLSSLINKMTCRDDAAVETDSRPKPDVLYFDPALESDPEARKEITRSSFRDPDAFLSGIHSLAAGRKKTRLTKSQQARMLLAAEAVLDEREKAIDLLEAVLEDKQGRILEATSLIMKQNANIRRCHLSLSKKEAKIDIKAKDIEEHEDLVRAKEVEISNKLVELESAKEELEAQELELQDREAEVARKEVELEDPKVNEEYDVDSILGGAQIQRSGAKFETLPADAGFRLTTDGTKQSQLCFAVPGVGALRVSIKIDNLTVEQGGLEIAIVGANSPRQLAVCEASAAADGSPPALVAGETSKRFFAGRNERDVLISAELDIAEPPHKWIGLQVRPLVSGSPAVSELANLRLCVERRLQ